MATLINDNAPAQANPAGTTPYTLGSAASDLLGQQGTDAANALYAAPGVTPQVASAGVNDLFSSYNSATQAQATADAQNITAQGDAAEAQQYLLAGGVADQNARLARVSANIQGYQEDRKILKSLGGQQADIAGANLGGPSGTSGIFLARDSAQQGALAKALIGVQGEITAGGFEQQGDAARAEADAANAASGAASTLAGQAASTGAALTTNALNNAFSLIDSADTGVGVSGTGAGAQGTSLNNNYTANYSTTDITQQGAGILNGGMIGRTGVGIDASAYVLTGGAPQLPLIGVGTGAGSVQGKTGGKPEIGLNVAHPTPTRGANTDMGIG